VGLRDAIGGLLTDELQLAQLASEAHRWAQGFDWERSAEVMAEAVREAAASA
jgi:hypothetical protein